jgi:hypothetical protein
MRITTLIKDMNYAAERAMELRMLREMGLAGRTPASYQEFLLMTAVRRPARSPVRRGILASALRRCL